MPERSILAWLAIGLVVGVVGKFAMPGKNPDRLAVAILLGIAGALVAGFVAETMRWTASGTWQNDVSAAVGALIVLAIYRVVRNHRPG
ncbi:MAG: GlsB/YeaQ/YmgE family stress response membrane protein [Sphingomonas sp.]|uniref:GlsB/YeaQ/YmgE family stress response membrane protein n=1 Tax=Sphingomonas sp. TaxID=28214 RepID=UPI0012253FDE|nr:GlsB/YeaQ/YmgE family stress response membrane protein [Sphingomonas sp.]THD38396.1 MAG: GlsB/YeaQ/YmgE family stress response membrane protein [Sphingomonas sp.]